VASRRALGALGTAGQKKAKDLPVLGPHHRALLGIIKHSALLWRRAYPLQRSATEWQTGDIYSLQVLSPVTLCGHPAPVIHTVAAVARTTCGRRPVMPETDIDPRAIGKGSAACSDMHQFVPVVQASIIKRKSGNQP
jgi:hypothetical protein